MKTESTVNTTQPIRGGINIVEEKVVTPPVKKKSKLKITKL